MHILYGSKTGLALFVICLAAVIAAPAQTFTTLDTGISSSAPLVQGIDGNLYGSNAQSGSTIFKITPNGTLSTVHSFSNEAGGESPTGLALGLNGHLYGTTEFGGQSSTCPTPRMGCGTVFGFNANGTISTLHSFSGADGKYPVGGLTLGSDGNFYGTTKGIIVRGTSYGNVFKITPTGVFTVLHAFSNTDGANPAGPLVLGTNGNLYGTTTAGGTNGGGTVFMITTGGTLTTLHNFNPSSADGDGSSPVGALVQAADGNFYGTALLGGPTCNGDVVDLGTIFLISPGGRTFQTVYDFCTAGGQGSNPDTGLVLGADGNFYGGASGILLSSPVENATLFEITPKGVLTTLYNFSYSTNLTLMQATNGTFYGTATGSSNGIDPPTIFSLSTGLVAFVTAVPPSRGIGARVIILGQGLTGATAVTFNGVTAAFTVNSDTEITTSVPAGAKTGSVQVTTPTGTLSTKVAFAVN
jgi:uncharacterized repeat protein (TIGR03803 family)